jgi:hypothetical protein
VARKVTQEQLDEILKCKEDALYFLTEYLWLKHTTKGKIRWDHPYDYQERMIRACQDGESIFVNKSRRVGATWVSCAFALWKSMFFPDQQILILSRNEFSAKGLLRRVKFMYENLPDWLKTPTNRNSTMQMSFVFRYAGEVAESVIDSLTTTGDSGRGEDASVVIMDEAASIDNGDDVWASIGPTAAFGGQRIVVSTPKGTGGFYYRIVMALQLGVEDVGFKYIEAHWKRDCGLSDEWYEKATLGLSVQKKLQEFELSFLQTGSPYFDLIKLDRCYKPLDQFPEFVELAQPTRVNFTGVDTSTGTPRKDMGEPDYHSIVTLNERAVQCYAFHDNRIPLREFAGHNMRLDDGRIVFVEGKPTEVHRRFPGILSIERWATGDTVYNNHVAPEGDGVSELKGYWPSSPTKMRMLNELRMAFNDEALIITDRFTYMCLRSFEDQSTGVVERAGAAKGCFDDPVIGLAQCWREWKRWFGHQYNFSNMTTQAGQRMVGAHAAEDLGPAQINDVLPIGQRPIGPITEAGRGAHSPVPSAPGTRSALDDFDAIRSGRVSYRQSRMHPSRVRSGSR